MTSVTKETRARLAVDRVNPARHVRSQPVEASLAPKERSEWLNRIVSHSHAMEEIFDLVEQIARVDSTVLVTGESGTGKELVAQAIHNGSDRAAGPFITMNMAAVPESLIESTLFGHVKGAFTSAAAHRIGLFEAADQGTIFLDEIGDLQPTLQAKMLRVLEDQVVTPVGGNVALKLNVRVVAATNRNLEQMMANGEFREDLYYRLNIVRVPLPPLRQRPEDIVLLFWHFLEEFCRNYQKPPLTADYELLEFLQTHAWPGNVRQLRNCVESMVVLSHSNHLTLDDIPPILRGDLVGSQRAVEIPDGMSLAELEEIAVCQVLNRCQGNRTQAAEQLGISVRTLQRKIARYNEGTSRDEEDPEFV